MKICWKSKWHKAWHNAFSNSSSWIRKIHYKISWFVLDKLLSIDAISDFAGEELDLYDADSWNDSEAFRGMKGEAYE